MAAASFPANRRCRSHAGNPPIHQRIGELDARHHAGGTRASVSRVSLYPLGDFLAIERLAHVRNLLTKS